MMFTFIALDSINLNVHCAEGGRGDYKVCFLKKGGGGGGGGGENFTKILEHARTHPLPSPPPPPPPPPHTHT